MPRGKKNPNSPALKVYTLPKASTGMKPVAKISVPRVRWADLPKTLENLLEQANGSNPQFVRGTFTLY